MRKRNIILISLLIVALLPYCVICFYALPFADDFCYAWTSSQPISFLQKFLNQYLLWNGRYTADVLVNFHPLRTGKLLTYQASLLASLLATPMILFISIKQVLKWGEINSSANSKTVPALIAALFITLFYLCYLPDITEGVYWFIGITNYHLGDLCLILHLALLLQSFSATGKAKIFFLVTSLALLIVAIGFNEIAAALIAPLYLLIVIISFKIQNQKDAYRLLGQPGQGERNPVRVIPETGKLLISFFLVALVSSMFVLFSPGNFTRESAFQGQHQIFHSLLYSSLQTIRFVGKWVLSVPFIALSLVVILVSQNFKIKYLKEFDWRIILIVLLFTVFTGSFLPYFATGALGQHRTINYVFFYFILLWIWLLISVSEKFQLNQKLSLFTGENKVFLLTIIALLVMVISGNGKKVLQDCLNNSGKAYRAEFTKRQDRVLSSPGLPIPPLKSIPGTFRITDTKGDTIWWADKCMARFYTGTNIRLE